MNPIVYCSLECKVSKASERDDSVHSASQSHTGSTYLRLCARAAGTRLKQRRKFDINKSGILQAPVIENIQLKRIRTQTAKYLCSIGIKDVKADRINKR